MNPFSLDGRVALVTGGNGGIGLGMARGFAKAGAKVVVAGRDEAKNAAAVAALSALGPEASAMVVDVGDEAACRTMVARAAERCGRLDILVNNAGMGGGGRPETMSLDDWRRVLDVNLTSAFVGAQAAYPLMKAQGGGKIINIGSMYGLFGGAFVTAYSVSKGGLLQLTKSLAIAWARDNIQVNAILPGWIDTAMTKGAKASEPLSRSIVARTPAGRWGEEADFEGPAVFLASRASDFVTGHSLAVDGGFAIQG